MEGRHVIEAVAIAAVTIIEVCLICVMQVDGAIATAIVGSIVFIVTRQKYKGSSSEEEWPKTPP